MALNETRAAFAVERYSTEDLHNRPNSIERSLIEAWFVGAHSDLGGANAKDGLSLYPLQRILSDAVGLGLSLSFQHLAHPMNLIDNPLEIMFPENEESHARESARLFKTANGMQIWVSDMRLSHRSGYFASRYAIKLNQPTGGGLLFRKKSREPFCDNVLIGYQKDSSIGVTIHPSVYFLLDAYPLIYLNAKSWGFRDEILNFRNSVVTDEEQVFWDHAPMETGSNLKAIRILICGNAGVGKTTLLNRIFGTPLSKESERAHGKHDIEEVFTAESNPGLLIHDSCGFQAGDVEEVNKVKSFLRKRSTTTDITERLHAIWYEYGSPRGYVSLSDDRYCTMITRTRATETADILFFETMSKCASEVPIIVVGTRVDEYVDMLEGKCVKDVRTAGATSRTQMVEQLERMDAVVREQLRERQEMIAKEFQAIDNAKFFGPVFVSKDSADSLRHLERVTLECLDNDHVRRLYVSAQICDVDQKIDSAITETIRLYRHSTRTAAVPMPFSGAAGTSVVSVLLCSNIVKCFGYSGVDAPFLDRMLRNMIWSSMDAHSLQLLNDTIILASEAVMTTGVGLAIGLVGMAIGWVGHMASVPASARCVLMCACDIILILERAFWYGGSIGPSQIRAAVEEYKSRYKQVHSDVKKVVPLTGIIKSFQFTKVRMGIEGVIHQHRFQNMDDIKTRAK